MNRKKRWEIVICLILIWIAVILQAYSLYRWDQEEKILETFDILDSVPVEGCIEMSASINKLYLNQKEKKHVLEDPADELGLGKDYEICQENRENTERTILKKREISDRFIYPLRQSKPTWGMETGVRNNISIYCIAPKRKWIRCLLIKKK